MPNLCLLTHILPVLGLAENYAVLNSSALTAGVYFLLVQGWYCSYRFNAGEFKKNDFPGFVFPSTKYHQPMGKTAKVIVIFPVIKTEGKF